MLLWGFRSHQRVRGLSGSGTKFSDVLSRYMMFMKDVHSTGVLGAILLRHFAVFGTANGERDVSNDELRGDDVESSRLSVRLPLNHSMSSLLN
jgi:hypothetical protein